MVAMPHVQSSSRSTALAAILATILCVALLVLGYILYRRHKYLTPLSHPFCSSSSQFTSCLQLYCCAQFSLSSNIVMLATISYLLILQLLVITFFAFLFSVLVFMLHPRNKLAALDFSVSFKKPAFGKRAGLLDHEHPVAAADDYATASPDSGFMNPAFGGRKASICFDLCTSKYCLEIFHLIA